MKTEKQVKKLQIEKMILEKKNAKEIAQILETNISYVYKVQKSLQKVVS
jgi:DNA-binding CsgD family transcriptional regulator